MHITNKLLLLRDYNLINVSIYNIKSGDNSPLARRPSCLRPNYKIKQPRAIVFFFRFLYRIIFLSSQGLSFNVNFRIETVKLDIKGCFLV